MTKKENIPQGVRGLHKWASMAEKKKIFFEKKNLKGGIVLCAPCKKNKKNHFFIVRSECRVYLKYISILMSPVKWNYMGNK